MRRIGAWDGRHFSNTANLILNENCSAVLIEGDAKKFEELKKNCADRADVIPVHGFVAATMKVAWNSILGKTPIPRDFDFLSIDIDGNDYHAWEAVQEIYAQSCLY